MCVLPAMKTTTCAQDFVFFGKSVAECEVSLVTELMLRSKGLILSHLAVFRSGEWVYKPNSVPPAGGGGHHFSRTHVTMHLVRSTRGSQAGHLFAYASVPLCDLAPGGVWPAGASPRRRCALTAPFHPYRDTTRGGVVSVPLSVGLPLLGVTQRLCPVEFGLSSA